MKTSVSRCQVKCYLSSHVPHAYVWIQTLSLHGMITIIAAALILILDIYSARTRAACHYRRDIVAVPGLYLCCSGLSGTADSRNTGLMGISVFA